jgi:ADP-ribose pyrophosphatase
MKPWKRIEPTIVTKVGHRTIVTKTFLLTDSTTAEFEIMCGDGQIFVAVVAVTEDNKIVIARQFRAGPELVMDELPGGGVEKGETPEAAVRRELREETGYEVGNIEYMGQIAKDAYINGRFHFFWATGCRKTSEQELDLHELIEVDLITADQLIENAITGRMTEQALVLMAYDRLKALSVKNTT